MSSNTVQETIDLKAIKPQPLLTPMQYLYNEVRVTLMNDDSTRNPRDVIDKYISDLDYSTISYHFSLMLEHDVPVRLSGNLKPTTPKQMAVLYIRYYLWQYIKSDKKLKQKYATTVFGSSFV